MHFSSIRPMDKTLSITTTPVQSGHGSDGNEGVLRIPQSSSITGTSSSDCLVSYPGHSLEWSYPSVEVQSVYSTVTLGFIRMHWAVASMCKIFSFSILLITPKEYQANFLQLPYNDF